MCKLCIKQLGFLKRRIKCKMCDDTVCNECCGHKVKVSRGNKPNVMERVCDACFGGVTNMIGDDLPLLSVERLSTTGKSKGSKSKE